MLWSNNRDRQPRVVNAVTVVERLLFVAPQNVNLLWLHYAAHTGRWTWRSGGSPRIPHFQAVANVTVFMCDIYTNIHVYK